MHSTLDSWHARFLFPSMVRDGNTFAAVVFPVCFGLSASGIGHNHKMLRYVWNKGEIIRKVSLLCLPSKHAIVSNCLPV